MPLIDRLALPRFLCDNGGVPAYQSQRRASDQPLTKLPAIEYIFHSRDPFLVLLSINRPSELERLKKTPLTALQQLHRS